MKSEGLGAFLSDGVGEDRIKGGGGTGLKPIKRIFNVLDVNWLKKKDYECCS